MKKPMIMLFAEFVRFALYFAAFVFAGYVALRIHTPTVTLWQAFVSAGLGSLTFLVLRPFALFVSVLMVPWPVQAKYLVHQMSAAREDGENDKEKRP